MSFSLSNLFGNSVSQAPAAAATPAQSPATPGNIPDTPNMTAQTSSGTASNGVVPAQETKPDAQQSPLAEYKDLWDNPTNASATDENPIALDPTKLQEVMGRADFSNVLSQENLAAIAQGGEGAMKALTESLNAVARQVMTQSTLISNKMIEQAIQASTARQQEKIPDLLKQHLMKNNLSEANPIFNDPAIKPVIEAVQTQLAAKFPHATAGELTKMAQSFVTTMGEALAPKPTVQKSPGDDSVDWSIFFQ